ncbi:MAG TPA: DUF3828 domain-containing protein [Pyrinomonadaceae bacterium]|nr:DUF3828 domain-containing protein [Pyrinomonadaceae bacterium]
MKTTETLSLAAALLLLSGCSHAGQERPQAAAPSATQQNSASAAQQNPQAPAQPSPTAARPTTPPEAFVSNIYKEHDADRSPFFQTEDRARVDRYFDKALADLIWKDAVESKGEVGALGADPLYNAQDTEIKNFSTRTVKQEDGKAEVAATFDNFGQKQRIVYRLVSVGADWKIAEIDYGGGTTLSKMLKQ